MKTVVCASCGSRFKARLESTEKHCKKCRQAEDEHTLEKYLTIYDGDWEISDRLPRGDNDE